VRGSLLTFFGQSMKYGESWDVCKTRLLREYFPLFVKEKMIRELVVFNFQKKGQPIREFIKEVIDAAEFLQYNALEADVVERVLMNLNPDILAQAALLPRPNSFRELRHTVGLIEERLAVLKERQRPEVRATGAEGIDRFSRGSDRQRGSAVSNQQAKRGGPKCWKCNRWGHFQKDCRQGISSGAVAVVGAVEDQSMKNVGEQVTKVEVCSDQVTGSNEHKGVRINSQHKQEVVKPKMGAESLTGSNERTDVIIDNQHKCEVVKSKMCVESSIGSKHKSEVMGSLVRRRGPRCPRRQTRQGMKVKEMVGKAESTSNPPLWVNLDFKHTQIPSLVDTSTVFMYQEGCGTVAYGLRSQREEK